MRNRISAAIAGWSIITLIIAGSTLRIFLDGRAENFAPRDAFDYIGFFGMGVGMAIGFAALIIVSLISAGLWGYFWLFIVPAFVRWTFTGDWKIGG